MTRNYTVRGGIHTIRFDTDLIRLTRTSDPHTKTMLLNLVEKETSRRGRPFRWDLTRNELTRLSHEFGEQYAQHPCRDLDAYFDILNNRWRRRALATHAVQHYLFGNGKSYRASISSLCAAGEAIAGYAMLKFSFTPIARPLGIMPDLLCDNGSSYALTEAKSSVSSSPEDLRDKHVHEFLVDVITRVTGFYYAYEAFLVCTQFRDGGQIDCAILHLDITSAASPGVKRRAGGPSPKPPDDQPQENLTRFLRLATAAGEDGDAYLTELLHDEAVRAAVLTLITSDDRFAVPTDSLFEGSGSVDQSGTGRPAIGVMDVERFLDGSVRELGLTRAWETLQARWPKLSERRGQILATVTKRLKYRQVELE
jgi:hypothetical protein